VNPKLGENSKEINLMNHNSYSNNDLDRQIKNVNDLFKPEKLRAVHAAIGSSHITSLSDAFSVSSRFQAGLSTQT
jgi:hypothetical protein